MGLTATQISQLNNSMEAAQRINLGTVMNEIMTDMIDSGSVVPSATRMTILTDLSSVEYVTCSLSGSPTLNHYASSAVTGSATGYIVLTQYSIGSGSEVSFLESSGSTTAVFNRINWTAVGTLGT